MNNSQEKIRFAIQAALPISITAYTLPHECEEFMAQTLSDFLMELEQPQMIQYLTYCLNELTTNAKKANTKRIYFKEKKLDITNVIDYENGMKTFKSDTLNNIKHYLSMQKNAGLYVKFTMQTWNNKIKIEVSNNSALTVFEYRRIHDKLIRARQYKSVEVAMTEVLDESEGAGLGLIIMTLMLEKIGLTEKNYQVLCENGETITRIILPLDSEIAKKIQKISMELVQKIDALPILTENLQELFKITNEENFKISAFAKKISEDPILTAFLIKKANEILCGNLKSQKNFTFDDENFCESTFENFSLKNSSLNDFSEKDFSENFCLNIFDAITILDRNGIKNFLNEIKSETRPAENSESLKILFSHSKVVADYAFCLAKNFFPKNEKFANDIYFFALIHDIAKAIFAIDTKKSSKSDSIFCQIKKIAPTIFQKIEFGLNHCEIGAFFAKKIGLPQIATILIGTHHEPNFAPKFLRPAACLIYLADMIERYQKSQIDFYQFDPAILARFKIPSKSALDQICKILQKI